MILRVRVKQIGNEIYYLLIKLNNNFYYFIDLKKKSLSLIYM